MDPYSYVVSARICSLVLPVGNIKRRHFDQYYARLQSAAEVRLMDVTPDPSLEKSAFNPQSFPNGKVVYRLETAPPIDTLFPMYDVEPWRELMVVFGIAYYKDTDQKQLETSLESLRNIYGVGASCHILVFGVPEDSDLKGTKHIIPILSSNYTSLETAMTDVTANLFSHLSAFSISKKLGSFKSPGLKILDRPSLINEPSTISTAVSSQDSQTSQNNGMLSPTSPPPDGKRPSRRHLATPSGVVVSRSGSISMGLTERAKSKQRGRSLKFMGNLYLLAGKLPEALNELSEAATILKASHDHLWFASALESIGVCLVLQAFYEFPVTIPTVAMSAISGDSDNNKYKASKEPVKQVAEFLPLLMDAVLRFYGRCSAETEESVPQTMYHETVLRFANMLAALRLGGGWNGASLSSIVRETPFSTNITPESPTIPEIEQWCALVLNPAIEEIPARQAIRLLTGLSAVYSKLGLKRKWAFVIQHMLRITSNAGSDVVKEFPPELLNWLYSQFEDVYNADSMKIAAIQNFITLATRMGSYKFVANASTALLAKGAGRLDNDEQRRIYQVIKDDGEIDHEYWDPMLLRDIKLPPKSNVLAAQTQVQKQTSRGNVVYNPSGKDESEPFTMIQDDVTFVHAYLQNPFGFEVHIYEIAVIDSDGNKIGDTVHDVFLPADNVHRLSIGVKPSKHGELRIGGCFIQVSGCVGHNYWLKTLPNRHQLVRVKPNLVVEAERRHIEVQVLPARPTLILRKTSLQKGWAMLLEGERTSFSLEIANISATPSMKLQFGFNDSTVEPLKQAMAKPDISKTELYELEHFLHERRAVQMLSDSRPLKEHSSETYEFELSGKRGITAATILVDYGVNDLSPHRLRVPIPVTVYSSVELDRVDITLLGEESSIDGDILVLLDLRNSWRQALTVDIWSVDEDDNEFKRVSHRIDSFRTERFFLPMKWSYLSRDLLMKPIPSLSGRQYVVDSKTTQEQIQQFWLRELLLKKLFGEWRTVPDENVEPRVGTVEFRGIQLTKRMVNILRANPFALSLSVKDEMVKVDNEFEITATITNKTSQTKSGILRFIPDSLNKVIYTGNLQRPLTVEPGEPTTVTLKALPLVHGRVEWTAIFDVIGGGQAFQKEGLVVAIAS